MWGIIKVMFVEGCSQVGCEVDCEREAATCRHPNVMSLANPPFSRMFSTRLGNHQAEKMPPSKHQAIPVESCLPRFTHRSSIFCICFVIHQFFQLQHLASHAAFRMLGYCGRASLNA